jgi:Cys-tRNA(Pro)/Cys-tRNA(Cys) deacylase
MTPAIDALRAAGASFQILDYEQTAHRQRGIAAAAALGLAPEQVFKTLIAELSDRRLVAVLVPVEKKLSLKKLARSARAKSAWLAERARAERATGYVLGGISPLGQKSPLPTFLAEEGSALDRIYVSAGRRGLELALAPDDLVRLTSAVVCRLTA